MNVLAVRAELCFKRLALVFAVFAAYVVFLGASPATATLEFYDPFAIGSTPAAGQYAIGSVAGQNPTVGPTPFLTGPWTVATGPTNVSVQAPGLAYLGAPALGGSLATIPDARPRRSLSTPWTATTTGTYYISYQVNFGQGFYDDGISGADIGYRATEFFNTAGNWIMGIAYNTYSSTIGPAQQDPRTARMYADFTGVGGAHQIIENSPDSFMLDGTTHLIVLKFQLSDQNLSDSVLVYLDPTSTLEPDLPGAGIGGINFTLGGMGGFSLFGGSGTFPVYDELRVATTFAEALPVLPLPGDCNGDLRVDMDDYAIIAAHYNQEVLGGPIEGDVANAIGGQGTNRQVDIGDYRLWRDNYNPPAGSGGLSDGAGQIPEPGTITLLSFGLALLIAWQRCNVKFRR